MTLDDLQAAFNLHTQQAIDKIENPFTIIEHPFALAQRLRGFREAVEKFDALVIRKRDRRVVR